ncbi:hypothetical protein MKW98_026220 [Papaver atlanticum]|uniref:Delta(3)-Delta(2)-enoyl-CoA isomerase n=1 Tax=Papaver atlanticum TaxID=357466 RepID=A0AAD4T146_9MAGN|nr:hypothetical protein MKW98_026220 [Papaver atlanticum]
MCSLEKSGNIFILTLTGDDEHRLNAMLIESIRNALKQVRTNAKPGSVLVTTAQGKFFSNRGMSDSFKVVVADMVLLPMPTVAAVSGHAVAAEFLLALSHDYIFMRKDKGVLYMSELNIMLNGPDYFMAFLKSKIPSPRVRRDVLLQSMIITAEKAVEMGIIDFAYDTVEETKEAAMKLAVKLGSNKWNGEVSADIRMNSFPEICEFLPLTVKLR